MKANDAWGMYRTYYASQKAVDQTMLMAQPKYETQVRPSSITIDIALLSVALYHGNTLEHTVYVGLFCHFATCKAHLSPCPHTSAVLLYSPRLERGHMVLRRLLGWVMQSLCHRVGFYLWWEKSAATCRSIYKTDLCWCTCNVFPPLSDIVFDSGSAVVARHSRAQHCGLWHQAQPRPAGIGIKGRKKSLHFGWHQASPPSSQYTMT